MLDRLEVRELDLRAARGRRLSQRRHDRARRRLHIRRLVVRLLAAVGVAAAVVLADAPGPPRAADRIAPRAAVRAASRCPLPATLRHAFVTASTETHVPLPLLAAVARVESRFQQNAHSRAGAVGLLQLMPGTARVLHYDAGQPSSNVMAGALYLHLQLTRYRSTTLALAAYNAGPTAVDRLGASPTAETAAYVARVTRTRLAYGQCS